ncbi:subtilase [Edwardsiella tarda]|nr:subtilase [Edwardsiella tarda]
MTFRKQHLKINGFFTEEKFKSKKTGRNPSIPIQDRTQHGNLLYESYKNILRIYEKHNQNPIERIDDELGVYVEIIGMANVPLPLDSLDNRTFKLCSCNSNENRETAVVFIPDSQRHQFIKKIHQYLDPSKDSKPNKNGVSSPRNHSLIDSISDIKLANLASFWTDHKKSFPSDKNLSIWWELWLKKTTKDDDLYKIAQELATRIGGKLGNTSISFFNSFVILIKASANELEKAPELISNLEEIRKAKETPTVIINSSPKDQQSWLQSISSRVDYRDDINTSVLILDTGVNYNNRLLSKVCSENYSVTWDPEWPNYDEYPRFNEHGSLQAGLAAFGNLMDVILEDRPILLSHFIESARILPPRRGNDPALYGAITVGTAYKLEINNPDINRVYSLAVTSTNERESGKPSSWSADIDQFCSGIHDGKQRLFVISAGNNLDVNPEQDYWDQVHLAQIEDPAQAWNAITVGAYTEMTTNDDLSFKGWAPLAKSGDISPSSRSSVNWEWRRQAPIKPDVVAEGGNLLLSPDHTEVSCEDTVALLTTSGKTSGQVFERGSDTSAACALVSNIAAQLTAEYPDFWPETVRGLIIHSSEWTERMSKRFEDLCNKHTPRVAKETLLRTVGYGVPNIEKARYSANHALTLIVEGKIQPFIKVKDNDPKINQMKLYTLPWPLSELQKLSPTLQVKLKVTLSYFIEPNPGRRGYRTRFAYQSHGLRFETIRPGQSLENFRASINGLVNSENYDGPEGDSNGWFLGKNLRTRGSIHSDSWTGSPQDLADMHTIAVFPVGGWWKHKTAENRWENSVRFSLLISIEVPDENIDIYSTIETKIAIENQIQI